MEVKELNRYKGQFLQGSPPSIKPPVEPEVKQFDTRVQVHLNNFSHSGWIPPKKGAI